MQWEEAVCIRVYVCVWVCVCVYVRTRVIYAQASMLYGFLNSTPATINVVNVEIISIFWWLPGIYEGLSSPTRSPRTLNHQTQPHCWLHTLPPLSSSLRRTPGHSTEGWGAKEPRVCLLMCETERGSTLLLLELLGGGLWSGHLCVCFLTNTERLLALWLF